MEQAASKDIPGQSLVENEERNERNSFEKRTSRSTILLQVVIMMDYH